MRLLSSPSTAFYKFFFWPLCVVGLGYAAVQIWRADPVHLPGAVALFVIGSGIVWWAGLRVKKVSLDDHGVLHVSDFRRDFAISLADVEKVTGSLGGNYELVWLHFRRATPLGGRIVFLPPQRFFISGLGVHPLVEELQGLARNARARSGQRPEATH